MTVVAIIQARMGSTRLPGKVMKPIFGRPMIHYVIERVERISGVDEAVVAIPDTLEDDLLDEYLRSRESVGVYRGPEKDVLARYYGAARAAKAEAVVRITADCPLISPEVSGRVLSRYLEGAGDVDYVSNCLVRTYPRGLDTEVFAFAALERAYREAKYPADREHVTPYMWRQPSRFRLAGVCDSVDRSHIRLTLDTQEDFELIGKIFEALYPDDPKFEYRDILRVLERHPEWTELNRHVRQKEYGE
ncbi:glycosyltransferase family protein [Kyrpidia sp.]|uniref:glycosyltransferase family protein n=1 Tax=Kyrpidia sp. TaxID=2073077 RepID=UPI0025908DB6|nr:glycosyltransferase family protein [Kyrpidia sp.]MCL6577606.1 glycosyltransferase family protein [Kyrpidia sp.]